MKRYKESKNKGLFFSVIPPSSFILILGAFTNEHSPLPFLIYLLVNESLNIFITSAIIFIVLKISKISLTKKTIFLYSFLITLITDLYSFFSSFYISYTVGSSFERYQNSTSFKMWIFFLQNIIPGVLTFLILYLLLKRKRILVNTTLAILIVAFLTLPWLYILPIRQITETINATINTGRIKNYNSSISELDSPHLTFSISFNYPATYSVSRPFYYEIHLSRISPRDFVISTFRDRYYGYEPYDGSNSLKDWYLERLKKASYPTEDFSKMKLEEITIHGKKYLKVINAPTGNTLKNYESDIFYIPFDNPKVFIDQMTKEDMSIVLGSLDFKE